MTFECLLLSTDSNTSLQRQLITISHYEPAPRCADVFLTRKIKIIYRLKLLCASQRFTALALYVIQTWKNGVNA